MSATAPAKVTTESQDPAAPDARPDGPPGDNDWRARLDRVFRQHERAIRASAVKLGKRNADDLVGDTFCKLVAAFARADDPIIPPATDDTMLRLVFASLRNAGRDAHRRRKTAEAIFVPLIGESAEDGEGGEVSFRSADAGEERTVSEGTTGANGTGQAAVLADAQTFDDLALRDAVDLAMCDLTEPQYDVLTSMSFDGESRHQMAKRLGISVRTVDAHLQAAYKRMRSSLLADAPEADSDRVTEMIRQHARRHAAACLARRDRKETRALEAAAAAREAAAAAPHDTTMAA